ncbi:DUF4105 domain-containing protein [Flavobacterium sp.]|uniref:lipoprotein N-acyltransferase Lnb domain-containing protein n=1 Tax=Flavobacterium sp. TaxID=239 RepID=UPI00286C7D4C|nr:DUF4105 domain-containing protein [Flavobacterium sp.]
MQKKIFLLFNFLFIISSYSQTYPITENTKISVLTVGTSNESHSLYGHTALRIYDSKTNIDIVYNYGMFDFSTENFMLKFVKGDLQYYAAAYAYQDFEYNYHEENRSIYEQVLNISLSEKQQLFDKLNTSLNSNDKFYTYKFIDRNCTTKVIDILNEVLVNRPIVKKNIDNKTYRDVLFPYVSEQFYQKLGISIIFGHKVDNQATVLFLPLDLLENLKTTTYNNQPLVSEIKTLFEAKKSIVGFSFLDSIYSLIAFLMLFVIFNNNRMNIVYLMILGIIGWLFSAIGLYSFHKEVLWNYNILLFNPLFLLLVFFIVRNNTKWIKNISILCLVFLAIYIVYMTNKIHFTIVLPIIITNVIILLRLVLRHKKLLPSVK